MAWTQLKNAINSAIKANDNQEITGQVLNNTLNTIVNNIGKYATFAGIATPSASPGVFEGPVVYFANTAGTYPNFGNITVNANQIVALYNIDGLWESYEIANNTITTSRIADGAVTTAKLADGAVETAKLAPDAVTTAKIANGAVTGDKIATGTITEDNIQDKSLSQNALADNAVNTAIIQDGAVTSDKLADSAMSQAMTDAINAEVEARDIAINNEAQTRATNDENLNNAIVAETARISPLEKQIIKFKNSLQDLSDDTLYITDKEGYVVAKIDYNGIESIEVEAKGRRLSEQVTDVIQDLYLSKLYITDGNGYVVAKIDETGISCIGINANNLLQNQWNKKNIATYGDSITALNGGNYSYPYSTTATNAKWGGKVAKYFNFANIYNRGIGSTTFNYYNTHGGQVAWCKTNTGEYVDRNDSYNYDNYEGHVTIPSDCTPIRGCGCSWLRITTMFPASIKDTIDVVLVMFHNDFHQDMVTECSWVENSTYDSEWAGSEYYENYGGDYNIETVRGGIASTYMKLQAWMPQALIVLMSPISGVYVNGNDDVMDLENPESAKMKKLSETVKDIAFRLSVPFIDVYGTDCINSLNKKLRNYVTDGIHPYSNAGCNVIARAIISGLHSIVPNINY